MKHEERVHFVRNMHANNGITKDFDFLYAQVEQMGKELTIEYLKWMIECVREMAEPVGEDFEAF